ncbi:MAG: prepilin-type N-terminal cleavage/methylation domain-containing protein [Candidatus Omnitrophica bacterium]|nr:prepilin-type N-terminal cleavage/methylation domain-containing protein [Candidatus Omnitrophota bacterium]
MRKGFTLIELLVAVLIFAAISVSIYSTFWGGVRTWKRAGQQREGLQELRILADRMDLELRNAINLEHEEIPAFEGEVSGCEFLSLIFQGSPAECALSRVIYSWDAEEGVLWRSARPLNLGAEAVPPAPEPFLRGLDSVRFFYAPLPEENGNWEWQRSWDSENGLPAAVRAEFGIVWGDEGTAEQWNFVAIVTQGARGRALL